MTKVLMFPHVSRFKGSESGIRRVVENYFRYLPEFGIELVPHDASSYDLVACHAGTLDQSAEVAHCHGLYWTADYPASNWEWKANEQVVRSVRYAKEVTVPSRWVQETFVRDMRFSPTVIPHGIDWESWVHSKPSEDYVLWNKNRTGDVCDPTPVSELAQRFKQVRFLTTFLNGDPTPNVKVSGIVPHSDMRDMVQRAGVYLATTKETFGIGILEAMAAGVPVLGYSHGGILDLVQHGVNGYLAEPGNLNDLSEGLIYCLENREVLGQNGQELSKSFSWRDVCRQVAEVYRRANIEVPPTVSVVIPSYNYGDRVGRAIESVQGQDYPSVDKIVIVDDGSPDNGLTAETVRKYAETDGRVCYIRQENQGVANARNRGISVVRSKYVSCLDADDAMKPNFLSSLIPSLEGDRSLGLVYSGLELVLPDGSRRPSKWPGPCNFDEQVQGSNQVPTCNIFRREVWKRLGGFKQRYAPGGAGAEDAEFWLRIGAAGWGIQQVTNEPLFLYSFGMGRTTGDNNYKEPDWLTWHPWVKDKDHPFASIATPKGTLPSHPVRQYDEPVVSFVVPVGPGHEFEVESALQSIEGQTFRKWEVIVVWDSEDETNIPNLTRFYPYVKWIKTGGRKGAGYARNRGAEVRRGSFLVFVDADDWVYPDYTEKVLRQYSKQSSIVYTDYVGRAIISPELMERLKQEGRLHFWSGMTSEAVIAHRSANYDCELARRQPEPTGDPNLPFYHWCLMTCLVPGVWHDEIGGFDESMSTWEDVEYHWRMARRGKCYTRLPEELIVYNFHTGHRREASKSGQTLQNVIQYVKEKFEEDPVMGNCSGCSGKGAESPKYSTPAASWSPFATDGPSARQVEVQRSRDSDFVKIRYMHPNLGSHPVYGPATGTFYGYRQGQGKEEFLIHRADAFREDGRLLSGIFVPVVESIEVQPPKPVQDRETPPPAQIKKQIPPPVEIVSGNNVSPEKSEPEEATSPPEEDPGPDLDLDEVIDLQALSGVTSVIAQHLSERGIMTRGQILSLGVKGLIEIPGCGQVRANMIISGLSPE